MSRSACQLIEDLAIFLDRKVMDKKTLIEYAASFVIGFGTGILFCELLFS